MRGRAHTLFRPHPQPLSHDVGEGSRAPNSWSAEAQLQRQAEASLPHSKVCERSFSVKAEASLPHSKVCERSFSVRRKLRFRTPKFALRVVGVPPAE
jgi:hypothetical protein